MRDLYFWCPGKGLDHRIAFLHIPKCGGTSIRAAVLRRYPIWTRFLGRACVAIHAEGSSRAARLSGEEQSSFRAKLLLYFLSCPRTRFVSGHFDLSDTAWREYGATWNFVTILRNPVERWFSGYFYNRNKASAHFRISADLDAFLETDRGRVNGCMFVQKLTGLGAADATSPEAVRQAIGNLERFTVLGVLERLDQFQASFQRRFGVSLDVPRLQSNPLPEATRRAQITPEIRRRVEELCQPDLEVYEHLVAGMGR